MGTNVCVFLFKSLILSTLLEHVADDESRSKHHRVVVVVVGVGVGVECSVSTKFRISTEIEIRANVRSYIYD